MDSRSEADARQQSEVTPVDQRIAAVAIFAVTYFVVAICKLPVLRLDRAGAALLGAALMVATGVLTLDEAQRAIDLNTITLLLGMMILVANLRLSGFFRAVTAWAVWRARHPVLLLASIALVSGLLSAFLVNDTVCLVLTPLVLELVQKLRRNPMPFLLATAMASNAGSTAAITGNPQDHRHHLGHQLHAFRRCTGIGCCHRRGVDCAADRLDVGARVLDS